MSAEAIEIRQLAKSYGSQRVLDGVSLSIPAGQTFALLGRNGAGKTTTIRILLGLIPADSGLYSLAVLGTCWFRRPVIGGILAILGFAVLTVAVEAFPATNHLEPINI